MEQKGKWEMRRRKVTVIQVEVECKQHAGHSLLMSGDDSFVLLAANMLRDQLPFQVCTFSKRVLDVDDLADEVPF